MGGFHLQGRSLDQVRATIAALRTLGVHHVAPGHCTGDAAIGLFRAARGSEFRESGCGAVIDVP